jgi:hypothetical protein
MEKVAQQSRAELLHIFSQYKYIGLSIDGVAIQTRKFLNVDVVHPVSKTCPFTYDFLTTGDLDTFHFVCLFRDMLRRMKQQGLCVGGVTSDGCSFQKKALHWKDPESIQFNNPEFSKLLFVPCICHRVQNSMSDLFKSNATYRRLITRARDLAVFLRKSKNREILGRVCPAYCATRWIYDYPLVRFIFNHRAVIHELFEEADLEILDEIEILIPLLEKVFLSVRDFEADHANCAQVYPRIKSLLQYLERHESTIVRSDWKDMYHMCALIIFRRTLETSNQIFQLAYVLTPNGRNDAHSASIHDIREEPLPLEQIQEQIETEMRELAESVGHFSEEISQDTEDNDDEAPPREMLIDELEDSPPQEKFDGEIDNQEEPIFVPDVLNLLSTKLCADAELGLREILAQDQLSDDECDNAIGAFQAFLSTAPTDLFLKPIPAMDRYSWAIASHQSGWEVLADIALRLEALVCNEAVSERTNSAMRRVLAPFRLRMGHDALLSRLTLSKHRVPGSQLSSWPDPGQLQTSN